MLVPAHNEEPVMEGILTALLDVDYPPGKLHVLPIDDRSKDRTGAIVDDFAARHPGIVTPFHRTQGEPGKAAALRDAMALVTTDIALVFDADYIPGRGLVKQLVAPFFDPEVGAVMGRVVPHNVGQNLLTRLLDLERTGGYQVDQQARMNLKLVPQYGGTVGGVRRRALESVGGWRVDTLAEDTDATFRLLRGGWKTVYQNRSECYEQVPTSWPQRMRQVRRWARGHNEALFAHAGHLLAGPRTRFREKLDGWLLLNVYMMSPIVMLGWLLAMILVDVINVRSFGWTVRLEADPWLFAQAVAVSVGAAMLASVYPLLRLRRRSPSLQAPGFAPARNPPMAGSKRCRSTRKASWPCNDGNAWNSTSRPGPCRCSAISCCWSIGNSRSVSTPITSARRTRNRANASASEPPPCSARSNWSMARDRYR